MKAKKGSSTRKSGSVLFVDVSVDFCPREVSPDEAAASLKNLRQIVHQFGDKRPLPLPHDPVRISF